MHAGPTTWCPPSMVPEADNAIWKMLCQDRRMPLHASAAAAAPAWGLAQHMQHDLPRGHAWASAGRGRTHHRLACCHQRRQVAMATALCPGCFPGLRRCSLSRIQDAHAPLTDSVPAVSTWVLDPPLPLTPTLPACRPCSTGSCCPSCSRAARAQALPCSCCPRTPSPTSAWVCAAAMGQRRAPHAS